MKIIITLFLLISWNYSTILKYVVMDPEIEKTQPPSIIENNIKIEENKNKFYTHFNENQLNISIFTCLRDLNKHIELLLEIAPTRENITKREKDLKQQEYDISAELKTIERDKRFAYEEQKELFIRHNKKRLKSSDDIDYEIKEELERIKIREERDKRIFKLLEKQTEIRESLKVFENQKRVFQERSKRKYLTLEEIKEKKKNLEVMNRLLQKKSESCEKKIHKREKHTEIFCINLRNLLNHNQLLIIEIDNIYEDFDKKDLRDFDIGQFLEFKKSFKRLETGVEKLKSLKSQNKRKLLTFKEINEKKKNLKLINSSLRKKNKNCQKIERKPKYTEIFCQELRYLLRRSNVLVIEIYDIHEDFFINFDIEDFSEWKIDFIELKTGVEELKERNNKTERY